MSAARDDMSDWISEIEIRDIASEMGGRIDSILGFPWNLSEMAYILCDLREEAIASDDLIVWCDASMFAWYCAFFRAFD